jgi:GNAT superfamily N-acetyltransferase
MSVTIAELPLINAPLATLAGAIAVWRRTDQERAPEDPVTPDEVYARKLTAAPSHGRLMAWTASDGATVVGIAYLQLPDVDNLEMGWAGVLVVPEARRRGIGRRLLRTVAERASAARRSMLVGSVSDRVPSGAAFARAVSANAGLEAHTNQLDVRTVGPDRIREWIEDSRAKAAGYRVAWVDWADADDGFRPAWSSTLWQADVAQVLEVLT